MSQDPKISDFLNGKPSIQAVEPSALFSRLRQFLPKLEEANQQMPGTASADAFQIEKVEEESSDDSSDSESDSEEKSSESPKEENETMRTIEIDLDVFKEQNSCVDGRDVSVQNVESLPDAFNSEKSTEQKKVLIEEI